MVDDNIGAHDLEIALAAKDATVDKCIEFFNIAKKETIIRKSDAKDDATRIGLTGMIAGIETCIEIMESIKGVSKDVS